MNKKLNPGSHEAKKNGCKCPIMDNNHGSGLYINEKGETIFVYNMDCPLHGENKLNKKIRSKNG